MTAPPPYPPAPMSQPAVASGSPPSTVRAAVALQTALVITVLLMMVVVAAETVHYDSLINQAARSVGADPAEVALERSGNMSGALFVTVPAALWAAWLGSTAWQMRRRSNVARILALVGLVAPLALSVLACLVGGLIGVVFAGLLLQLPTEPEPGDVDAADWGGGALFNELDRLSGSGWSIAFDAISGGGLLLMLLLTVATVVLLTVESARHYFQPRRPAVVAPYPAPGQGFAGPYPYPAAPAPVWSDPVPPRPNGPQTHGPTPPQG
jgi:hypothetical protein